VARSEQELQQALEQQEMLTREMSHRLENLFAIVDGIIRISARSTDSKDDLVALLSGRLHALAAAHSLVKPSFSDVQGAASNLADLMGIVIEPHKPAAIPTKSGFSLEGPTILCGEQSVNGLALIFHELATNAAKYGALGGDNGSVEIVWEINGDDLSVTWSEEGGERNILPSCFQGLRQHVGGGDCDPPFGGTLNYDWRPTGLSVNIILPLSRLAQ
jgi:two-component sensor histidine kinase